MSFCVAEPKSMLSEAQQLEANLVEAVNRPRLSFADHEKSKFVALKMVRWNSNTGDFDFRSDFLIPGEFRIPSSVEEAAELKKKRIDVAPELMVPLVGHENELENQAAIIHRVAADVQKKYRLKLKYQVGTMIEIPRACFVADRIAEHAEFFSFGTNDLTQMGFGYSRDDVGGFLPDYVANDILPDDPFQTLDQDGIGQLVELGVKNGRTTKPELKVGICGEHGGDPESVKFCHRVGLNYVSCSPFRVPVARLAAAHAALETPRKVVKPRGKAKKKAKAKK